MATLKYTGKETLVHKTGTWEPGDEREFNYQQALGMVQERPGDMAIVTKEQKPSKGKDAATPPAAKKEG